MIGPGKLRLLVAAVAAANLRTGLVHGSAQPARRLGDAGGQDDGEIDDAIEGLKDAGEPFKALGTHRESSYRCAEYCPLQKGQKNIAEFRCLDGRCIAIGNYCNGFPNCADGSDEASCPQRVKDGHDCDAGYANWGKEWSLTKKAWCCQHHQRGCPPSAAPSGKTPYTCEVGSPDEVNGWSADKSSWCCSLHGVGCTTTTATTTSTSSTKTVTLTSTTVTTSVTSTTATSTFTTSTTSTTSHTSTNTSTSTVTSTTSDTTTETSTSSATTTETTTTTATTTTATATETSTTSTTKTTTTETTTSSTMTSTVTTSTTRTTTRTSTTATTSTTTFTGTTTRTTTTATTTSTTATRTSSTTTTRTSTTTATSTTTTSTTNTIAATLQCSVKNANYFPLDMWNYPLVEVGNVAECQERCRRTPGCAHYSYWVPAKHCHLQDINAIQQFGQLFIAGPPTCGEQGTTSHAPSAASVTDSDAVTERKFLEGAAPIARFFPAASWRPSAVGIALGAALCAGVAGGAGALRRRARRLTVPASGAYLGTFHACWQRDPEAGSPARAGAGLLTGRPPAGYLDLSASPLADQAEPLGEPPL